MPLKLLPAVCFIDTLLAPGQANQCLPFNDPPEPTSRGLEPGNERSVTCHCANVTLSCVRQTFLDPK